MFTFSEQFIDVAPVMHSEDVGGVQNPVRYILII